MTDAQWMLSSASFKIISSCNGSFWERFSFTLIHQKEIRVTYGVSLKHSMNYLTFGGFADSTFQMSGAITEFCLKEDLTIIENSVPALLVKEHPHNACNRLVPPLSQTVWAADALCPDFA